MRTIRETRTARGVPVYIEALGSVIDRPLADTGKSEW